MTEYQTRELERLYRLAVKLQANPAGTVAPCEGGCGRIGRDAHHVVKRSQEPGIRWKYEPRFGVWLCPVCHPIADQPGGAEIVIAKLRPWRPQRAKSLARYVALHDRLKCKPVSFPWMRSYLKRCIQRLEASWSESYCEGA